MVKKKQARPGSKAGARKAVKKTRVKKTLKASPPKKKAATKRSKAAASRKRVTRKSAVKKLPPARPHATKREIEKLELPVEPGPPTGSVPPVEEPIQQEEAIGIVTHYYSHLGVGVVQVNKGSIRTGDTVHIKGNTTDFTQKVESMEYEHQHTDQAGAGQSVGLKVADHVREHDIVYLMK